MNAPAQRADGADPSAEDEGFDPEQAVIVYRGTRGSHDYVVLARHPFLEAHARLVIDGVFHDPGAEKTPRTERANVPLDVREATDGGASGEVDGLAFTVHEKFSRTIIQVRRPRHDGTLKDAERVDVRTRGVGGVGEVDVTDSNDLHREPLAPDPGSASAAREEKKTAHPLRYALVAALATAVRYLLPLLGLGALFSRVLDPPIRWVGEQVSPVVDAIGRLIAPPVRWIDAVLQPIRDAIGSVLRWLVGWIPDIELPSLHLGIPGWVVDVALPVVVVLAAGSWAYRRNRSRARRLREARGDPGAAPTPSSPAEDSDDSTTD